MLKKIILAFLSILVLVFVYLLLWILVFPVLKPYVENYISKNLNLKTEFQSIGYSFPCGLLLRRVIISDKKKPILISKEVIFVISHSFFLKRREPLKYIKLNSPIFFTDNIRFANIKTSPIVSMLPKIKWNNGSMILKNKIIKCDGELKQENNIIFASLLISPDIPLSARIELKDETWVANFFSSYKGFDLQGKVSGRTGLLEQIDVNSIGEYNAPEVKIRVTVDCRIESIEPLVFLAGVNAEGKILKMPVTLSGGLKYENKNMRFDDILISADKFKIICSGSYDGNKLHAKFLPIRKKHPVMLVDYLHPILKIINLRRKEVLLCELHETYNKKLFKIKGRIAGFDTDSSVFVSDGIYELLCNISKKGFSLNFEGKKYKNEMEFKSKIHGLYKNLKTVLCLSGLLKSQDRKISGQICISTFSLNGFEIKPITCNLNYYDKRLIKDIISENINGSLIVDIGNNILSGKMRYFLYAFSGKIDGTALVSGKITSPQITFDYKLENIKYNTLILSLSGKADILNGRLINRIQGTGSILETIKANINGVNEIPNLTRLDKMNGNIRLTSIKYKNINLDSIILDFFIEGEDVRLENIKIRAPRINIFSKGRLHRNKLNLQMKINNFELPYLSLYGIAEVSCDFLQPGIRGLVMLKDFWVNQYCIPKYEFSYKSYKSGLFIRDKDGALEISLKEKCKGKKILACIIKKKDVMFDLDGSIVDGVWSGRFHCSGLDFQHIVSLAGLKIPALGMADFSGSLKYTKGSLQLKMDSSIKQLLVNELLLGDTHLSFDYGKDELKIKTLMITGEDTEVKACGVIPVKKNKQINLVLSISKFPLHKFKNLSELIEQANGFIKGEIRIAGKSDEPLLYGNLNITDGSMKFVKYIDTLKPISGNIRFEGENGFVNISGVSDNRTEVLIKGDMRLRKLKLEHCNINIFTKGRGIHLKIPEWPIELASFINQTPLARPSYGDGMFNLNLRKKHEKYLLSGEISIMNACFSYSFERSAEFRIPESLLFDLKINFDKKSWIRTRQMNVKIEEGYISMHSDNGQILINGVIESRHGNINYLGRIFKIKHIKIEIRKNKPYIELTALTDVKFEGERQKIEMRIERAPLEISKIKFTNALGKEIKPEKLFGEIIGLREDMTPEEKYLALRRQLVMLIDSSLTSPLAKAILHHIPVVDDVSVSREIKEPRTITEDQFISMLDLLKGSKYTFEKYLTDELALGYSIVIGELGSRLALRHQIEVAYRLRGNIYLIGAYELASREIATTYIPERKVMIETHWRFGW